MQGKGIIITFAIVFGFVCLFELIPSAYVWKIENKAKTAANGNDVAYKKAIDKASNDTLNLILTKLNYKDAKKHSMNLGLDLKGGMNIMLQVSVKDLLMNLADKSENQIFRQALKEADIAQKTSSKAYLDLFFESFDKLKQSKNVSYSDFDIFGNQKLSEKIKNGKTTDNEAKKIISDNIEASLNTAFEVFRTRIDRLGTTQPNIQKVGNTGRIIIELPGETEIERIRKLLQTSAKLEFWRTAVKDYGYVFLNMPADNMHKGKPIDSLLNLYNREQYDVNGAFAGVRLSDTAAVNSFFKLPKTKQFLSNYKNIKFLWAAKPTRKSPNYLGLFAIEGNRKDEQLLSKGNVIDAYLQYDELNRLGISMTMDAEGAGKWNEITSKNIDKQIAIVLDGLVYSAPVVRTPIPDGRSSISGIYSIDEGNDLVNALKSGKLPATAKIVQADIVGPSLGAESIKAGLLSTIIAFFIILFYMIFYYGRAGWYANLALFVNLFFIVGILASQQYVLTLPGIAGIILTMGMAVDANIITFERIKDELRRGLNMKDAVHEGFKHSLPAILDGNITALITGIILWIFGTGPILGFAIVHVIGIICTLFTAVLISRILVDKRVESGKSITFWSPITKHWFENIHWKWVSRRKYAYIISILFMIISIISLTTKGLNLGVDYRGGRTYTVKLNKAFGAEELSSKLTNDFQVDGKKEKVEVKTIGNENKAKITTLYKIDDDNPNVDTEIENKLFLSLKDYLPANSTIDGFMKNNANYGIESSSKVNPTVSADIKEKGIWAVFLALIGIFLYILLRFIKWQFSTGAVIALFHDSIITLGCFSLLYGLIPFSLEVDQGFIAAILTVIGYSINDTVIVFDRIRENLKLQPKDSLEKVIDDSINQTLGRTINTVATVLFVIIIILIFGGDSLRSFMFALFLGISFGTFSSVFVASAIAYDLLKKNLKNREA